MAFCCSKSFKKAVIKWKLKGLLPLKIVELEGNYPPSHASPISKNTPNQNFEIAIFFYVIKRSGATSLRMTNPLIALRARVVRYALEVFNGKGGHINFGEGLLDWQSNFSNTLNTIQSDKRKDILPPPHSWYFSKIHLIGIWRWLLVVVETSKNAHSIRN